MRKLAVVGADCIGVDAKAARELARMRLAAVAIRQPVAESLYLLWVITTKLVAEYLGTRYAHFREEPNPVVSVRITQRFAGHRGVRLI